MAEIINLNRARKTRDKATAKRQAEANRLSFGRTKQERNATDKAQTRADQHLDGHKLTD